MEENEDCLQIVIRKHNLKNVQGIKEVLCNDVYSVWIWSDTAILICKTSILYDGQHKHDNISNHDENLHFEEFTFEATVKKIFQFCEDTVFVVDSSGALHSFQATALKQNITEFMEVDDLFSSPETKETTLKWEKKLLFKIEDCDKVVTACQLTTGFAVLAVKAEHLVLMVYSKANFKLKCTLDIEYFPIHNQQNILKEEVISSCTIALLSPSLKKYFQENLQVGDTEIIIIGLTSGLVLWYCVNTPLKGPFVLCSVYQKVQEIHWIKDGMSDLHSHLVLVLTTGRVVVFGEQSNTVYLPDEVRTSWVLKNYLTTSNFVDCYIIKLHLNQETYMDCVSLPVKGVCAITGSLNSDKFFVATIHGSVYSFLPTVVPSQTLSRFVIPDQSLLDSMFIQTHNLETVYKELSKEDGVLKAVSAAMSANITKNLFHSTVKIISGSEFSITTKILSNCLTFSHDMWLACVEVIGYQGQRKSSITSFQQDFNSSCDLTLYINHRLSISDVLSLELILFLENQQPLITVPINKIELDALYFLSPKALPMEKEVNTLSFQDILQILNKEPYKDTIKECKHFFKIPKSFNIESFLMSISQRSYHKFSEKDWSKTTDGKRHSIQISINNIPVHLNWDVESREVTITCCDVQLGHQVKKSIIKTLSDSSHKQICPSVVLDFQALHHVFEIEKLKENSSFTLFDSLWKQLRTSITSQLPV